MGMELDREGEGEIDFDAPRLDRRILGGLEWGLMEKKRCLSFESLDRGRRRSHSKSKWSLK